MSVKRIKDDDAAVELPAMGHVASAAKGKKATKKAPRYAVDKGWLKSRLEDLGMSMRDLSTLMGKNISGMSLIFDGHRGLRAAEAAEMARHLGVATEDLLRRFGADVRGTLKEGVPVRGWIAGDGLAHWGEAKGPGTVPAPPDAPEGTWALRIQQGVMDGWLVYFGAEGGEPKAGVGQLCLVEREGRAGKALRWVRRGYEPGTFNLGEFTGQGDPEEARVSTAIPVLCLKQ